MRQDVTHEVYRSSFSMKTLLFSCFMLLMFIPKNASCSESLGAVAHYYKY